MQCKFVNSRHSLHIRPCLVFPSQAPTDALGLQLLPTHNSLCCPRADGSCSFKASDRRLVVPSSPKPQEAVLSVAPRIAHHRNPKGPAGPLVSMVTSSSPSLPPPLRFHGDPGRAARPLHPPRPQAGATHQPPRNQATKHGGGGGASTPAWSSEVAFLDTYKRPDRTPQCPSVTPPLHPASRKYIRGRRKEKTIESIG